LGERDVQPDQRFTSALLRVTRSALARSSGVEHSDFSVLPTDVDYVASRGSTDMSMRCMEELAAVALTLGRHEDAANLLVTAQEAREKAHMPISPACRRALEDLGLDPASTRGTALTADDAVHLARKLASGRNPDRDGHHG
jgi:hypothetical protein